MKRSINYLFIWFILILSLVGACDFKENQKEDPDILAIRAAASDLISDRRTGIFEVDVVEIEDPVEGYVVRGVTTSLTAKMMFLARLDSMPLEEEIIDSIMVLPDPVLGEKTWALVNVSVCNIRTKPGHSQELTTQATLGTPVRVWQESGSWFRIQTPDHYIAWVDEEAILRLSSDEFDHWKNSSRMVFLRDLGFVRSMANPETVISDLTMGCILEVSGSKGKDRLVTLPDGRSGWVSAADLIPYEQFTDQDYPNFPSIFSLAEHFMGRPYLWGGTSPRGVDCSGFMKTLFLMNGAVLSRDANQQVLHGERISLDNDLKEVQPGDLLFFGRKATQDRSERVSHVGLYLGEGKFIHSSGRVRINSFRTTDVDYSEYLRGNLLHARRVTMLDSDQGPWSVKHHPWYNL